MDRFDYYGSTFDVQKNGVWCHGDENGHITFANPLPEVQAKSTEPYKWMYVKPVVNYKTSAGNNLVHVGVGGVLGDVKDYVESSIDAAVYSTTAFGTSIVRGFKGLYNDIKYNGTHAGEGKSFPGRNEPNTAIGFSFKHGFKTEELDTDEMSVKNAKRIINGTYNVLSAPMQFCLTSFKILNFCIDQTITNTVGIGLNKAEDGTIR